MKLVDFIVLVEDFHNDLGHHDDTEMLVLIIYFHSVTYCNKTPDMSSSCVTFLSMCNSTLIHYQLNKLAQLGNLTRLFMYF